MTDIESKKYRIRSTIGGYEITDKKTNKTKIVKTVPATPYLAAIHEREFDRVIGKLFVEA